MTFNAMGNWGNEVSLSDIKDLPLPDQLGNRHRPIPHSQLIETTSQSFQMSGYNLNDWKYLLSNDNQRMISSFTITRSDLPMYEDWSFTGAIMTSTNSTLSARLLFGQTVGVCDNGCVWAEHILKHKHTENAPTNLKYMILEKAQNLLTVVDKIHKETEAMKYKLMSDPQAHDYLVQSCIKGVLKWQHAPLVLEQWNNPEHEEFKPRNQWSLFNAYTSIWRERNQFDLNSKSSNLIDHNHDWTQEDEVGYLSSEDYNDPDYIPF
jgi:hypothetical protein